MARSARSKGLKDKKYLEFVGSLACVVCVELSGRWIRDDFLVKRSWSIYASAQTTPTEVAHVGRRGLSQKSSDRETIPLCARHHRTGKDAHHVLGRKFWEHHGLDRDAIILELNTRYEQEKAA